MSSKIHREGEAVAEPLAYRHFSPISADAGSAARAMNPGMAQQAMSLQTMAHQSSAQPSMPRQTPAPDHISDIELLRKEIEARVREAQIKGRGEGQAEAERAASARLDPVLKSFQSMIQQLSQQTGRVRAEAEEDVVKLSIAIARRVLRRELATDPDAILGLVKVAMAKLQAREMQRLRVAPTDAALITAQRSFLDLPQGLEIISDASLGPGSAVFETTRGELDASIQTQLAEIDRGLTDVLRRRS